MIGTAASTATDREGLRTRYDSVRAWTREITQALTAEDHGVQSMPDASPTKWHLAHTTWFFEEMLLRPYLAGYESFDSRFSALFNSYYESLGPRHPRPQRGVLTRPPLAEVWRYRTHVDRAMHRLLDRTGDPELPTLGPMLVLGLNHEQQHQELMLTDIKHAFSLNPLRPAVLDGMPKRLNAVTPVRWVEFPGGRFDIGHDGNGFAFDNETPRHAVLLAPYRLASRPVTCGEYLEFIRDGGYRRPEFWLSDGWATVESEGWRAPAYWLDEDDGYRIFTLCGVQPWNAAEPVCHLSYYEAAAYAEWAGARLPTEFEWEAAAATLSPDGHRSDLRPAHPLPAERTTAPLAQMFGEVWEWTRSAYAPYPGFRPLPGAVGEYNGKFMVNQLVLRGGSCVTPPGHLRACYRNFFPPAARWQFSGLRLARDAS